MTWKNRNENNSTNYTHPNESNLWELHKAMGYDPQGHPVLRIDDTSLQHTSRDRAKVSNYEIVFFNTFQFDKEEDIWDEVTTTGGTAYWEPNSREVIMEIDATVPGASVYRQTRAVQRYIPGRTSEASMSTILNLENDSGIRKRIGVFDERNGMFLEVQGTDISFVIRSDASGAVLETRIPQAEWNQNKLDGSDGIGTILDLSKRQIILFEYEWYGAGICELKFIINDHPISAHKQYHANRQELPWLGTPFIPFRVEIENISATAGTFHLHQGSNSFLLEGTSTKLGVAASVGSPITGTSMSAANNWYPVLSIRIDSSRLNGVVLPTFFQVATIDNTTLFYRLVRNPVIGTGGGTWQITPDTNATITEYQTYTNPSAITDINQGTRLDTGFVTQGGTGIRLDRDTLYQLGRSSMGTVSDVFTILCASSNTNKNAIATMTWIEQR